MTRMRSSILAGLIIVCGAWTAAAQPPGMGRTPPMTGRAMPDAKQMSGMPLPVGDIPVGTVAVRVVRGSMANPLANQAVELLGGPSPLTVKTNETGHAEFAGLRPGMRVKAVTTVNGERLESQEFDVPSTGGIRVALVATDPEAEKKAAEDRKLAQAPAQPGIVVLGGQSRFVFEFGDEGLNVFNIFQIVNTARTPVQPPSAIVFDFPDEAESATVLEGSSPQAHLAGKRLTVAGPFAPGTTLVQVAYTVKPSSGDLTIEQKLPAALNEVSVMAQKVGDMHLASPQITQHQDLAAEGQTYIVGQGPAVQAGQTLTFSFSGLPHTPAWPRNLALVLAVGVLAGGIWGTARAGKATAAAEARRGKLQATRDRLFAELTAIEEQHHSQSIDPTQYTARRRDLVAALERVYAEMDEAAAA
jgi:hypothetical protein